MCLVRLRDGGSLGAGLAVVLAVLHLVLALQLPFDLVNLHLTPTKTSARGCFQESDTPIALSLGGTTILVTPSAAMTPPAAPVAADIDCEGSWECLAGTVRHRQNRPGIASVFRTCNRVFSKAT